MRHHGAKDPNLVSRKNNKSAAPTVRKRTANYEEVVTSDKTAGGLTKSPVLGGKVTNNVIKAVLSSTIRSRVYANMVGTVAIHGVGALIWFKERDVNGANLRRRNKCLIKGVHHDSDQHLWP